MYQDVIPRPKNRSRRLFVLLPFGLLSLFGLLTLARFASSRRWGTTAQLRDLTVASGKGGGETFVYATPCPEIVPYEVHPIRTLMEQARKKWDEKVARQSRTYDEAVSEYRRRYRREPPKGFQMWYDYAVKHNVQLIDEYDFLSDNILPFHSLSPAVLRGRIHELTQSPNHAFVHIRGGAFQPWTGATWRDVLPELWQDMTAEFVSHLPDLDFAIFLHDGASTFMDAEAKKGYEEAALEGRYVNESELPIGGTTVWQARSRTCLPGSKFLRAQMGLENQNLETGPSFIQDHVESMDYCSHPNSFHLHGSTSSDPSLDRLEPTFSLSKTNINGDLLYPATLQYDLNPPNELAFRDKPVHKVLWRGSPDGIYVGQENAWRHSHRFRAIYLTNSNDTIELRKVRVTRKDWLGREYQVDVLTNLGELNARYSDVRPTHKAVQCEEELCRYLDRVLPFVGKSTLEEMASHRYVLDIDGNAYSARFRTHLFGNQVPLKSTRFPEWYTGRIEPWLHYVPLRQDYSDLYNILAFFDGDLTPDRNGNHDDLAETIALEGKAWAEKYWRPEDTKAYLFRLLLEYARLMDLSRVAGTDLLRDEWPARS